jgi:hypothetical protein
MQSIRKDLEKTQRINDIKDCIEKFERYKTQAEIELQCCHQYNAEKKAAIRDRIKTVLESLTKLKEMLV